jgi:hypothetical protein
MKRWSMLIVVFCLFLLVIFLFNLWLKKESEMLSKNRGVRKIEEVSLEQKREVKPLEIKRRSSRADRVIKKKKYRLPEIDRELSQRQLKAEEREAEELGIKPKKEEMDELLKKNKDLIIY